jgi:circadian clock protein KaiB
MPASKKTSSSKRPKIKGLAALKRSNSVPQWRLRLYVAGNTPNSISAFNNLKQICEMHLKGQYDIELIDLLRNPQLAKGDQIVAIPTLVRKLPPPLKQIIGDLSNQDRVLVGLDLRPANSR